MLVGHSELVLRLRTASIRRLAVPHERLILVTLEAKLTALLGYPESELRIDVAAVRRLAVSSLV